MAKNAGDGAPEEWEKKKKRIFNIQFSHRHHSSHQFRELFDLNFK